MSAFDHTVIRFYLSFSIRPILC